jgi:endo-1,4-beta-xylanase
MKREKKETRIPAIFFGIICLSCSLLLIACGSSQSSNSEKDTASVSAHVAEPATASNTEIASIAETYKPYFTIGAAVEVSHLSDVDHLLKKHFNRLTCENRMKMAFIHPAEDTYTFDEADQMANFARENNMTMTGHALLWHQATPAWVFADLTPGDPESIETLKSRLKSHIETVITRYADVVDNWDVVNEAISDNDTKVFRDADEGSQWHKYFGGTDDAGREYIYWAFKYAKDALEKIEPGSAKGRLYYNDYNTDLKKERILDLVNWMRDEKGLEIDGIGMQAHWKLSSPSINEISKTIDAFVAAGYLVKISELDTSLYNDYTAGGEFKPAKEVRFDEGVEALQAERFRDLFALFRERSNMITSVTTWGVADNHTWLKNFPVRGRNNHPLLFGIDKRPKGAAEAILDF